MWRLCFVGELGLPKPWMALTPFKDNQRLTQNMIRYNYVHSSIRATIERAFGLLKGRFRRLKYLDQENVETMTNTIAAACCLHNICIIQEDLDEYFERDVGVPVPVALLPPGIFNNDLRERGFIKRNRTLHILARR